MKNTTKAITCDGCGIIDRPLSMIAKYSNPEWVEIYNLTLCPKCYGAICTTGVNKMTFKDINDVVINIKKGII